jgi:hypothetical protein
MIGHGEPPAGALTVLLCRRFGPGGHLPILYRILATDRRGLELVATRQPGVASVNITSSSSVANTWRPSRSEIARHTQMPRTLLPYSSSPRE